MHLFSSKFVQLPAGLAEAPGSVTAPGGFIAAGVAAGIKRSGKLDLGILVSQAPCESAAVFTPNAAAAAPVRVTREECRLGSIQGVVVNSANANACTGATGTGDANTMSRLAAAATRVPSGLMAVASTGIIGVPLPMQVIEPGIAAAAAALKADGGADFAEAIRTTDSVDKEGAVRVELAGGPVTIGACAKGAGMIAPNMATLLAFVTTDARLRPGLLQEMLGAATTVSFNAITVDGDMSTNDFVLALANGASGVAVEAGDDERLFGEALGAVCQCLALKMVADGEGATKVVRLEVRGAASREEAARVAKTIASSQLVQAAFYGRDANWGRLMGAAGAALAGEAELNADIHYEELCLARSGAACDPAPDSGRLKEIMDQPEISVVMELNRGSSAHAVYFSDLTHDYVTLNAEYTT